MSIVTGEKLQSFAQKFAAKIESLFVKKESGKGLSTNDYTTTEKSKLAGIATGAEVNVQADWTETSTASDAYIKNKPTTLDGYGITSVPASKLTGTVPIDNLPAGALERVVVVADDTARFKLTKTQVQTGDTVKVTSTGSMYFVKDDTKLTSDAGYEVYTAGMATAVAWSGITGKPSTFPPAAHKHTLGEITDYVEISEDDIDDIIAGVFTS